MSAAAKPATGYCAAQPQTLHWTVSLYIDAGRLFVDGAGGPIETLPCAAAGTDAAKPLFDRAFDAEAIRAIQMRDPVSRALRNAVEPLFNDIADREWMGNTQDFVLAADDPPSDGDEAAASAWARATIDVDITAPAEVGWTTEGKRFVAALQGLATPRRAVLRRFWFVHNNGALSYHLSFALGYAHDPADYYFLALLQKLTGPKEFALAPDLLDRAMGAGAHSANPLDDVLGIAPLDDMRFAVAGDADRPFWHFVRDRFGADMTTMLARLARAGLHAASPPAPAEALAALVERTPIPEVPGLAIPKCRTLLFFHDPRFFARLIPPPDAEGNAIPRRAMVRADCYAPYAARLREAIDAAGIGEVRLVDGAAGSFWHWARERPDDPRYTGLTDAEILAIRAGTLDDGKGGTLHVPAFERGRTDCLDYLFLSGFNQNIIDFMNQDTSEILDSLDPIYPATEEQQAEGFFVRYANHRAMITYAPHSRSLETGNDYIGTCPYAFLIHTLSLHNEFLARAQERESVQAIDGIHAAVRGDEAACDYAAVEAAINRIKISGFQRYERHAHVNMFRYDTERDVFAELELLRGTRRKHAALERALLSLEDLATDLEARKRRVEGDAEDMRKRNLEAVVFVLALLGAVQFLFGLADYAGAHPDLAGWKGIGHPVSQLLGAVAIVASIAVIALTAVVAYARRDAVRALLHLPPHKS
ncbi:hypothetical protein [Sphingomonas baiyangensis]|uniref:Uncharacterized protein n=1 Tax=Sphingomonas baiyangensis TaxID=2572576 RepID=A0A4U1KZP6_9SPHN|nr:hypothetical protein [Sphingomonas baiyangensis]TKD49899.1 hypothetical protein FBR43_03290 [Sphingomonas baiyangensis]